jgi:hypothetical protein
LLKTGSAKNRNQQANPFFAARRFPIDEDSPVTVAFAQDVAGSQADLAEPSMRQRRRGKSQEFRYGHCRNSHEFRYE